MPQEFPGPVGETTARRRKRFIRQRSFDNRNDRFVGRTDQRHLRPLLKHRNGRTHPGAHAKPRRVRLRALRRPEGALLRVPHVGGRTTRVVPLRQHHLLAATVLGGGGARFSPNGFGRVRVLYLPGAGIDHDAKLGRSHDGEGYLQFKG